VTSPGPPKLSPPDPEWPKLAQRLIEQLKSLVSGLDRADEFVWDHIGSTSVPGLAAKPFIDLQLGVPSLDHLDGIAPALEPAGFVDVATTRPGSPGVLRDMARGNRATSRWDKRLFASQQAILHVRQLDSAWWHYTTRFRDLLRADAELRGRYQRMKLDLAEAHGQDEDYDRYTIAKTEFFDTIQDRLDGL
jgi:dephospho-CoA kinase